MFSLLQSDLQCDLISEEICSFLIGFLWIRHVLLLGIVTATYINLVYDFQIELKLLILLIAVFMKRALVETQLKMYAGLEFVLFCRWGISRIAVKLSFSQIWFYSNLIRVFWHINFL